MIYLSKYEGLWVQILWEWWPWDGESNDRRFSLRIDRELIWLRPDWKIEVKWFKRTDDKIKPCFELCYNMMNKYEWTKFLKILTKSEQSDKSARSSSSVEWMTLVMKWEWIVLTKWNSQERSNKIRWIFVSLLKCSPTWRSEEFSSLSDSSLSWFDVGVAATAAIRSFAYLKQSVKKLSYIRYQTFL